MKEHFEKLLEGSRLTTEEAHALMLSALSEPINQSLVASFLTILRVQGVTVDELQGFCGALMELASPINLGCDDLIDVCGTGGDNKGTFNISTATAFILAAAGYKVAKHGNYAVSSSCGSSNVLEAVGIPLEAESEKLQKRLAHANVCFLHAPLFHPAMKRVAPIRKELGFRTVFNMLGPLVNPARPQVQVHGVYDRALLRRYGHLLRRQGKRFAAFYSTDGYDEVTLTAPLAVVSHRGEHELMPSDFGLEHVDPATIQGGRTIEESALMLKAILSGNATQAQESVVAASAGLAMWIREENGTLIEQVERAREIVRTGAANRILERSIAQL